MRNLIAALIAWLMPPTGKRRAPVLAQREQRAVRRTAIRPLVVIDGDALPMVRPYVVAHERKRELRIQRERRTALALATVGIDYEVSA